MESVFLFCFAFGAIFSLNSVVLSVVRIPGQIARGSARGSVAVTRSGQRAGLRMPRAARARGSSTIRGAHRGGVGQKILPLLNLSSLLAFLSWFGGLGYVLDGVAGLPLLVSLPPAIVAGLGAAELLAWFMDRVVAGERVMDPADYQKAGAAGRVTVSIPAGGVGEVQFVMGGTRRSEAARGLSGQAIARNTEVVIIRYARGVADVLTLEEFTSSPGQTGSSRVGAGRESGV